MVTTLLRRALPAAATLALLACAPSALAATVTSGDPLTVNGQTDTSQNWAFDDTAGSGIVTGYFDGDAVAYDETNPLPSTCTDWDAAGDPANAATTDGTASTLRCTGVTRVVANAGDAGSFIDAADPIGNHADGLDNTPIEINGGDGSDQLFGGKQADTINAGAGNDWAAGYQGNDTIDLGADNDEGAGGPGNDTISGGDGNDDYVAGGPDADTVNGGAGDDTLYGGCGGRTCGAGTDGNDVINAGDGSDYVDGEGGDDTIDGGAGDDRNVSFCPVGGSYCYGGLYGGDGNDTINGGDGSDYASGDGGSDKIDGGNGADDLYGDCGRGCPFESGNDTINGGDGNDYVSGDDGNDTIDGGAGDDGASSDASCSTGLGGCDGGLSGGNGDDVINGGDGSDYAYGGEGNDTIDGGAGDDGDSNLDFSSIVDSSNFAVPGLAGGPGDDKVSGGAGNDVIENDQGNDTLSGDAGADYFVEGGFFGSPDTGADTIVGGDGVDSYQYWTCASGANGDNLNVSLDGQPNDSRTDADAATTDDTGNNVDVDNVTVLDSFFFFGSCPTVNATLVGNDGANSLIAGRGNDTITGGKGPDRLDGEGGDDTFNSRDGYPDLVECGEGTDSVVGDNFDTYEACENVDSIAMRSAYDLQDQVPPAPPIVLPPGDHQPPKTGLTTDTRIHSEQLLNGVTLNVTCDEPCTIEGRLLGSEPVGSRAHTSALRGFNMVLGRKYAGLGSGKRKMVVKPCVRKSKRDAAACRDRLRASWKNKRSFTVKVQVTTRDKAGNRTRKTKLVKVTVKKTKRATR